MSTLKHAVLCLGILAATLEISSSLSKQGASKLYQLVLPALTECGMQSNVDIEAISGLSEAKKMDDPLPVDGCFYACIFKKTGFINARGKANNDKAAEKVKSILTSPNLTEAVNSAINCFKVYNLSFNVRDKDCKSSLHLFQCLSAINYQGISEQDATRYRELVMPALTTCGKKFNTSIDAISNFIEAKKKTGDSNTSNTCFYICAFNKTGFMNAGGKLDKDVAVKKIQSIITGENLNVTVDIVTECFKVPDILKSDGDKQCKSALLLFKCLASYKEKILNGLSKQDATKLRELVLPAVTECDKNSNTSVEIVRELIVPKNMKDPDALDICFYACVFKKTGIMNVEGKFDKVMAIKKFKSVLTSDELKAAVDMTANCFKVNDIAVSDGDKGCEIALHLFNCLASYKEKISSNVSKEDAVRLRQLVLPAVMECSKDYTGIVTISKFSNSSVAEKEGDLGADDTCFHACILKKIGFINAEGKFDKDVAVAKMKSILTGDKLNITVDIANDCFKVNNISVSDGKKGCERALLLLNCTARYKNKALIQVKKNLRELVLPAQAECSKEFNMSVKPLSQFRVAKNLGNPDVINNCFHACFFKKLGVMNAEGKFDKNVAVEKVKSVLTGDDLKTATDVVTDCSKVNDMLLLDFDSGCERGLLLSKCFSSHKDKFTVH